MYCLKEYPAKIAKVETQTNQLKATLNQFKDLLSYQDAEIEAAIAKNKELKNEQQRKAKRFDF